MTELDHKTFDLGNVIAGIKFPEDDVTVYFNEDIGYQIHKAETALRTAEIRGNEEALRNLDEKIEKLKKEVADQAYTVTLRGIPDSTRRICDQKSREKFEVEYSFLGQPTPNPERDDYFSSLLWAESIVKVTDPSGAVALPDEKTILDLRNALGRTASLAISNGIRELVDGAKSGFESAAKDVDFLSDASPEG